ncbi:MAG: hypothetical protein K5770_13070 [Lachnospiraceae bacterium]|nr:hypothetical protein [Lachnospiraceae bacterium]
MNLIKRGTNEIQDGERKGDPVRVCIAGGKSNYARHDSSLNTRVNRIVNINNMILKVMEYKSGINYKKEIETVKIQ